MVGKLGSIENKTSKYNILPAKFENPLLFFVMDFDTV
jgi:hypothetical protein